MILQEYQNQHGKKQYKLTVPIKLVEAMEWKKNDDIKFRINKYGQVVLKKR